MIVRMSLNEINVLRRATQGVRLIRLKDNQFLSTVAIVDKEDDEEDISSHFSNL